MTKESFTNTSFLKAWVFVTTLGYALLGLLNTLINVGPYRFTDESSLSQFLLFSVISIAIVVLTAFLQSRVLRHRLGQVSGWIVATVVGTLLSSIVIYIFQFLVTRVLWTMPGLVGTLSMSIGLVVLGAVQRVVLERKVAHSAWWILIVVLAYIAGNTFSAEMSAILTDRVEAYLAFPITSIIYGLTVGLITGVGLVWLIRGTPERKLRHREALS